MAYNWKGKKILIAEDEEYNFMLLEEIFDETHVKPVWAKNGQEAVDYMKDDQNVDLILMDIKMPILNGLEATKKIREKNINIPIIAQTAYAMSADRKKCLSAGCTAYIEKPIDPENFLHMISRYMEKK